jgi:hypothetical protein
MKISKVELVKFTTTIDFIVFLSFIKFEAITIVTIITTTIIIIASTGIHIKGLQLRQHTLHFPNANLNSTSSLLTSLDFRFYFSIFLLFRFVIKLLTILLASWLPSY